MPPLRLRKLNAESGSTRETMSLVAHWKGRHDGGACRPVAETARAVCSEQRHQAHRGPHAKGAGVATAGCGRGLAALRGNARMCLLCEKQPERRGVGRRRADQLRSCAFDHVNFARVRQNGGQVTSRYALRGHVYAVGSLQAVAMAPNSRTWSELRVGPGPAAGTTQVSFTHTFWCCSRGKPRLDLRLAIFVAFMYNSSTVASPWESR